MFKQRSYQPEYLDNLTLSGQTLRDNLDEIERVNTWLGGKKVFLNALNRVYQRYPHPFQNRPIALLDIGCGNGDLLRLASQWSQKRQFNILGVGIDANSETIAYAQEKSRKHPHINFQTENIFTADFQLRQFDLVTLNLFCHHFPEQDLSLILQQLTQQTRLAIVINDLHRHFLSYYAIKLLTRFLPCSYLLKNDAPLSVLKSFRRKELLALLQTALPAHRFCLRWLWPFRWQVIIWCSHSR